MRPLTWVLQVQIGVGGSILPEAPSHPTPLQPFCTATSSPPPPAHPHPTPGLSTSSFPNLPGSCDYSGWRCFWECGRDLWFIWRGGWLEDPAPNLPALFPLASPGSTCPWR